MPPLFSVQLHRKNLRKGYGRSSLCSPAALSVGSSTFLNPRITPGEVLILERFLTWCWQLTRPSTSNSIAVPQQGLQGCSGLLRWDENRSSSKLRYSLSVIRFNKVSLAQNNPMKQLPPCRCDILSSGFTPKLPPSRTLTGGQDTSLYIPIPTWV